MLAWNEVSDEVTWEKFFQVKGVDYKGDEVMCAKTISWESVSPALPLEVGGVALSSVVELGSLHYVQNFSSFLLDPEDQVYVKPPRVMVEADDWEPLCRNLLTRGIFDRVYESEVYHVQGRPLLNGLFGVSKQEFTSQGVEVMRIVMNLIPVNSVVRCLDSDISTLPTWSGVSPLELMVDDDLIVSSEDVRCFFYIFRIPQDWFPYMCFNRPLPDSLAGDRPGKWFPCSAVLPMGFKNSVALAQHIHRMLAKKAVAKMGGGMEMEMRKDRPFSSSNPLFRIYLDNFDELRRVSKRCADVVAGSVSPLCDSLRQVYEEIGVPRHPKKSVAQQRVAEAQGAIVDGSEGVVFPKPQKVLKYLQLTRLLLEAGECNQKQMQIVGGGLVYFAMFRRPLLGGLNHIWKFVLAFEGYPPVVRLPIPSEVKAELARMVALVPLAFIDFRCNISKMVTASDASTTGGGISASTHVSASGAVAAQCAIRGDIVEPADLVQVLTIGMFDGISGLRTAADALGWNVSGHVSIETSSQAARVVEARFPNTIHVSDVELVDEAMVEMWSLKYSQVGLVFIGAGPPWQGVSGLNASKKGALRDARSVLFTHVRRVRDLVRQAFPWAQVRCLMESVASMNSEDEQVMSADYGGHPVYIDSADVSLAHRPRLYWVDWELVTKTDVQFSQLESGRTKVQLKAEVDSARFLSPGWKLNGEGKLPTFTTARPSAVPGFKPAGLNQCSIEEARRWKEDCHRFPPYQYRDVHCLRNSKGELRVPTCEEREVILGFPKGYTVQCMPKAQHGSQAHVDCRLTLLGNSWNVTTVAVLMSQLGESLGLNPSLSVQDVVNRTSPGSTQDFQSFLLRPSMSVKRKKPAHVNELLLVQKLMTLVGIKGDDLLLQAASDDPVKYQRLRAAVPAKLWKWQAVAGWAWNGNPEHINVLEMRAALTSLRWRLEKHQVVHSKFIHLVDSLVVLHSLSRGRSSSHKLKRTLMKINALVLATGSHVVWAYVHTKDNPADEPSRRPQKRKWKNV